MRGESLPIVCAWCERVRTSVGRWEEAGDETVVAQATHGICPDCLVAQTREAAAAVAYR
jgi:hypothetical protein